MKKCQINKKNFVVVVKKKKVSKLKKLKIENINSMFRSSKLTLDDEKKKKKKLSKSKIK